MVKNASHIPSFIVIVSCYKPRGSILNFIELILKSFIRGVPKGTGIFQDFAHQSLMCFLFYRLGISVYISSQEAKGPISLSANITDMCVPSQIICDSTWYFLCFREPFPPDYMKHRHFWSVSLLFASYCIWQVESFQNQCRLRYQYCTKKTTRDQGQCPEGHQTKPGPSPILLRLKQLRKEYIHFSVFRTAIANSLLSRNSCGGMTKSILFRNLIWIYQLVLHCPGF